MGRLSGRTPPSRTLDVVGLVMLLVLALGPVSGWLRMVPAPIGFGLFAAGGVGSLIVGALAVGQAMRGRGTGRLRILAGLAGIAFVAFAVRARGVAAIDDFTTDLENPPAFRQATAEPANEGRDMSYPRAFAAVQRSCCGDLGPARLSVAPATAFVRVEGVVLSQPDWTVTRRDPAGGELEATATTRLFGFHDDIVIRVRPEGTGSRVDVRTKSRDGHGELGTNVDRIRLILAALQTSPEQPSS